MENNSQHKLFTLSEFRREVGLPLVLVKKLALFGEIETVKALDGTLQIAEDEARKIKILLQNPRKRFSFFVKALGPGIITGASDDDPSGIGTYSSVGAKFGLSVLWMALWILPVMLATQEACARIGIVTNKGLAGVLLKHYRKRFVAGMVLLLVGANIINIGADLGAMSVSLSMIAGVNFYAGAIFFAVIIIAVEILMDYRSYMRILKWLTLSVFAYIATGFILHPDWKEVFSRAIIPEFQFNRAYLFATVAIFGTTITPYLFFWQASEEVEENKIFRSDQREKIRQAADHPENNSGQKLSVKRKYFLDHRIRYMRTDVATGMILANLVFFFIILTTAQALFANGIHSIETVEQAALALRPFGGDYAYVLFALGIIGTGLLAIPVLASSGAYAIAEVMKWREGLEVKFSRAKGFYLVIASSIFIGLALNFFHINPIKALYYSAFINGIISLPLLAAIMVVGGDKKIMGNETHPKWVKFFGWAGVFFMGMAIMASIYFYI